MEITDKQIAQAVEAGYRVTVIINGELYTYKKDNKETNKERR